VKNNFIQASLLSFGFLSAISLTALSFSHQPTRAQTPNGYIDIAADGNLNEYSPATAPLLVRGTVTPAVKDVQILLKELGFYNGNADSIYGPKTVSAVISFQKSRNLTANGAVNKQTWEALINADSLTSSVPTNNLNKYSLQTAQSPSFGSQRKVATIDNIHVNPSDFLGKTITLSGQVQSFLTPNTFTLDDPQTSSQEYLLVLSTAPVKDVSVGNRVQVTGTVRQFNKDKLVQEFGVNPSLVGPITSYYRNLPVIVTQSTQVVR
jgi:peptidoglycan hydrolase-like protein with peptidoglycan-binding domain